jgi:hypothetical protein
VRETDKWGNHKITRRNVKIRQSTDQLYFVAVHPYFLFRFPQGRAHKVIITFLLFAPRKPNLPTVNTLILLPHNQW